MSAQYRPVNLARTGKYWVEAGRAASFSSSRPGFGVENVETGELYSSDGVSPAAWRTRGAAAVIAEYAEGMPGSWVRVFDTVEQAAQAWSRGRL